MKAINLLAYTFTLFTAMILNTSVKAQNAEVNVTGAVAKPFKINAVTFASMKRISVTSTGHDGKPHNYSGVSLYEILTKAEAVQGNLLKGKTMAKYVLVTAADNYQVVFAIPEFDPAFTDQTIILADEEEGEKLAANLGPYRLVVPKDKKQARSVMRVTGIEVQDARKE